MRIVCDLGSLTAAPNADILQVEKSPDVGEFNTFNGRFGVPVPDGASLEMKELPDPYTIQDVADQLAGKLLARFPMYSNIFANFLLSPADVADLDLAATVPSPVTSTETRAMAGRGGASPFGTAPNMTQILPANNRVGPAKPGLLVTEAVDIGPVTSGAGADEFLVWWWLWDFDTTDDIMSSFGGTAGVNAPALKQVAETDQEPADFTVYLSHDDGTTWTQLGRLEPTDLVVFNTDVRLAFVNTSANRVYLAAYAVMF